MVTYWVSFELLRDSPSADEIFYYKLNIVFGPWSYSSLDDTTDMLCLYCYYYVYGVWIKTGALWHVNGDFLVITEDVLDVGGLW